MMENDELDIRIRMCKFCISVLENDCKDDPRQPDALEHYKKQLEELRAQIIRPTFDDVLPKPPDVVVNLKPAIIFGNVPK